MMRLLFCALFLLLLTPASAAVAQTARDLIAEANAADVFEPLADQGAIAVRHPRSGFICRMAPANRNRLVIFDHGARGDNVACDSGNGKETITLYATRYLPDTPLPSLFSGAYDAIRQRYPDAREYQPQTVAASDGVFPQSTAHFFLSRPSDGARMYSRLSVAVVDGWSIKLRYSAEAPDEDSARVAEQRAQDVWLETLGELARRPL